MPRIAPFSLNCAGDQQAFDWIEEEVKRHNGVGEAVFAYVKNTQDVVARWHDKRFGADLDGCLKTALCAGHPIVLHHNHPTSGSFISLDLETLVGRNPNFENLPGLAEIWAHGKDGTRYRAIVTSPEYVDAIITADRFMEKNKQCWSDSCDGHEVFSSGWRHLVCLCLESKDYIRYDYNVDDFPNYSNRDYLFGWASQRMTMERAFPIARDRIIGDWGKFF